MKQSTKTKLLDAWDYCDNKDKSTEFMLAYMADVSGLSYEAVVDYVTSTKGSNDRYDYYKAKGDIQTANIFKPKKRKKHR